MLIFVVCLFYSFTVFSAGPAQNKPVVIKNTPPTIKVNPKVVKKPVAKKEIPITIALEKKGRNLYVKLSRAPAKVDLFTYKIRLHTFIEKGSIRFNITPYLSKVRKNNITVFAHSAKGTKYHKDFNLEKYRVPIQKKKKISKIISPVPKKNKKQPTLKKVTKKPPPAKGPVDHTKIRGEIFIPGGIELSIRSATGIVERGMPITVTYQFVRTMDHLPEEVEFRVGPRLTSMPGELLETIRFSTERPGVDMSAIREVSLVLPFGLRDEGSYIIKARSVNPSHSGKSSAFRISTPEESLDIFTPDSSDKFPPGVGLNIPVEYSFLSGPAPSRVTIQISRELGGYNRELYSGPPLSSHSLPRPPDSCPAGDYRIVVTTDDGRIGYSDLFSLSPYRFSLITPVGGETYRTKYSPWRFRWHAEGAIDFIEAVLIKGGVEKYRWTPHVHPPDHLIGDDLLISHSQPWHPAGTDYKLKIEGYRRHRGDTPTLVAVDESDRNFEVIDDWEPPVYPTFCNERIPISIIYPARSTTTTVWENNKTYPITWCVNDESVGSVNLSLVNASTGELWSIRMGVPNSFESSISPGVRGFHGGSMDWTVPEPYEPGNYRLHIESVGGSYENTTYYGIYIRNWLIKGASPGRSEAWHVGDTRTIEWESGGLSDETVDIFLRHWDSIGEHQIADNIPNTGRLSWSILSEDIPESFSNLENVYFKIVVGRFMANSEYFTIVR